MAQFLYNNPGPLPHSVTAYMESPGHRPDPGPLTGGAFVGEYIYEYKHSPDYGDLRLSRITMGLNLVRHILISNTTDEDKTIVLCKKGSFIRVDLRSPAGTIVGNCGIRLKERTEVIPANSSGIYFYTESNDYLGTKMTEVDITKELDLWTLDPDYAPDPEDLESFGDINMRLSAQFESNINDPPVEGITMRPRNRILSAVKLERLP